MKMKMAPKDGLTLLPCFYFVELPIVACSMLSLYLLELQPAQGGYRCHQPSLSLPYVAPASETVPLLMLLSLAFAGPAATIMLGEGLVYALRRRVVVWPGAEGSVTRGDCTFNAFLRRTVLFVGVHVLGLCATALITDVIQLSTGYYAPFFLTVCQPNYTLLSVPCDLNPFIHQDICSGHDRQAILTARKTFPSQHATLSAFAAVYVSMYLDQAVPACPRLLKPVLVLGFWLAAGLVGLTQVTQHRSHAHDVWAGALIGAFIAAYLACHAVDNFRPQEVAAPGGPAPPWAPPDALRALAERGHDSVYNKGPASASQSSDQICGAPRGAEGAPGPGPAGEGPAGGPKRASMEAELCAPRSPMGKETMVTFSHTLPCAGLGPQGPAPPPGPQEPVLTWQQKVTDRREEGSEAPQVPVYPPVVRPRTPLDPGAPAVSPKSALTRAKWLAITERSRAPPGPVPGPTPGPVPGPTPGPAPPRLLQAAARSRKRVRVGAPPRPSDCRDPWEWRSSANEADSQQAPPLCRGPAAGPQRTGLLLLDPDRPHQPQDHLPRSLQGPGRPGGPETCSNTRI